MCNHNLFLVQVCPLITLPEGYHHSMQKSLSLTYLKVTAFKIKPMELSVFFFFYHWKILGMHVGLIIYTFSFINSKYSYILLILYSPKEEEHKEH